MFVIRLQRPLSGLTQIALDREWRGRAGNAYQVIGNVWVLEVVEVLVKWVRVKSLRLRLCWDFRVESKFGPVWLWKVSHREVSSFTFFIFDVHEKDGICFSLNLNCIKLLNHSSINNTAEIISGDLFSISHLIIFLIRIWIQWFYFMKSFSSMIAQIRFIVANLEG